jgi:hypothetical protein
MPAKEVVAGLVDGEEMNGSVDVTPLSETCSVQVFPSKYLSSCLLVGSGCQLAIIRLSSVGLISVSQDVILVETNVYGNAELLFA